MSADAQVITAQPANTNHARSQHHPPSVDRALSARLALGKRVSIGAVGYKSRQNSRDTKKGEWCVDPAPQCSTRNNCEFCLLTPIDRLVTSGPIMVKRAIFKPVISKRECTFERYADARRYGQASPKP